MKRILLFSLLLFAAREVFAVEAYSLAVGPYITVKTGVNAGTIEDGHKTGVVFNSLPDFGLALYIPFTKSAPVGMTCDIGYRTESVLDKPNDGATDKTSKVTSYHYLSIAPMFNASAFTAGLVFGIPTAKGEQNLAGDSPISGKTSDMAVLVSIQLGVNAAAYTSEAGQLNILGLASYGITGLDANPNTGGSSTYNPHTASIAVGLEYLFHIR
jgi:hypothetical protein